VGCGCKKPIFGQNKAGEVDLSSMSDAPPSVPSATASPVNEYQAVHSEGEEQGRPAPEGW
jgi:hypothetical protein